MKNETKIKVLYNGEKIIYDDEKEFRQDYNILRKIDFKKVDCVLVFDTMQSQYHDLKVIYNSGKEKWFTRVSSFNKDYSELLVR